MSEENVKTLRQAVDAVNRRDKALWMAACDPEIENIPPREWPESEPTRGPDAIWDFFIAATDPWGAGIYAYTEITEASHDDLVAHIRGELRGKVSGALVTWSFWQVVKMRNGTAVRIEWFTDRSDALKAVGLAE
jgi:ketosteroid isomerase-like protein